MHRWDNRMCCQMKKKIIPSRVRSRTFCIYSIILYMFSEKTIRFLDFVMLVRPQSSIYIPPICLGELRKKKPYYNFISNIILYNIIIFCNFTYIQYFVPNILIQRDKI